MAPISWRLHHRRSLGRRPQQHTRQKKEENKIRSKHTVGTMTPHDNASFNDRWRPPMHRQEEIAAKRSSASWEKEWRPLRVSLTGRGVTPFAGRAVALGLCADQIRHSLIVGQAGAQGAQHCFNFYVLECIKYYLVFGLYNYGIHKQC
jgi:hypothetical protein